MLPSGMFILPSKFGYIITGKYPYAKEFVANYVHCFVGIELFQSHVSSI